MSNEEEGRLCWEITRTSNFYSAKPPNQKAVLISLEESLQQQLILSYWKKIANILCRNCLPIAAKRAHFALTHTHASLTSSPTGGQQGDPLPQHPSKGIHPECPPRLPVPQPLLRPECGSLPSLSQKRGGKYELLAALLRVPVYSWFWVCFLQSCVNR